MSHEPAVLRARAGRDIEEAIDCYLGERAPRAAPKFIDALEQALGDIERHPAIDSTRYATELDLLALLADQRSSRVLYRAR